jgi:hypothetical protein
MVLFFEAGRLGNQLLQCAVLRGAFPGQRLCFFGLQALQQAAWVERAWFVPHRGRMAKPAAALRWLLDALVALRLVGEAWEQRDGESAVLARRRGLLPGLVRVRLSFFQHAAFEPAVERAVPTSMALRPEVLAEARRWLMEQGVNGPALFLHLRRGDYLQFPDPATPAVVDDAWVFESLTELRRTRPGAPVVVCSDDLPYARALLAQHGAVVFCDRGELGDLAVMSLCDGGVLSPSTFSWWAAFFARQRWRAAGATGAAPHFIAPRFWVGHRRGAWYPEGFHFPWIDYR